MYALIMDKENKNLARIDRAISKFNSSYMSNTKWKKLFLSFCSCDIPVKEFALKYVGDKTIRKGSGFLFEVDYKVNFSDAGFKDPGIGGPVMFKEIEWIEFVDNLEFRRHHDNPKLAYRQEVQTLDPIENLLTSLGEFEYHRDQSSLRLYAYK